MDLVDVQPGKVPLAVNADERGSLIAIEHLPFEIKRVFTLTNLDREKSRANHAVSCDEFITLLSGSCRLNVKSKKSDYRYLLTDPTVGYFIPAGLWIQLSDFSQDAILMVACSKVFEETDYHLEPQI